MDQKRTLGEHLRAFRRENGYSQSHIANILGVERSTYTYYEVGKTTPVVFDLMRLADLYGTTLDDLLGFHADSSDPLSLGDPRQPVKAVPRLKAKERYLSEVVQDLSGDERQLLAYYRSSPVSERKRLLVYFQEVRRSLQRRSQ